MKVYTADNLNYNEVVLMPTKDNEDQNTNNATHTLWTTKRVDFIIRTY